MKFYILHRADGGIEIMQTRFNPEDEIAKWPAKRRAEITGTFREISAADIPHDRLKRNKWYDTGTSIGIKP